MKEQNRTERVDILGIGMDDIRVDRAVSLTGHYLENNRFEYITFVNTAAALNGQDRNDFIEFMEGAALVLPGDNNIEHAVGISHWEEGGTTYQAQYFKRLFQRLHRQRASVFFLAEQEESLTVTKQIVEKNYDRIRLENYLWEEETDTDALINHINDFVPDALIICGGFERIGLFIKEHRNKINTEVCICAAAMAAGENYTYPEWVRMLHLEHAYICLYEKPRRFWHNRLFKNRMKKSETNQEEN